MYHWFLNKPETEYLCCFECSPQIVSFTLYDTYTPRERPISLGRAHIRIFFMVCVYKPNIRNLAFESGVIQENFSL